MKKYVFLLGLAALSLTACKKGGENKDSNTGTPPPTDQVVDNPKPSGDPAPTVPSDWKKYENDGYSMYHPKSWAEEKPSDGIILQFMTEQEGASDMFLENVNAVSEDVRGKGKHGDVTLEEYTEASLGQVEEAFEGFNLETDEDMNIGPFKGHAISYTGRESGMKLKWFQYFFLRDQVAYVLTYCAETKKFDKHFEDVKTMFASFRL